MPALKLLAKLLLYYAIVGGLVTLALWIVPEWREYLPIGRVQALITQAGSPLEKGAASVQLGHIQSLGASLVWLMSAMIGALLTALPVAWVYMEIRHSEQYDQSLIGTIVVLPIVVTSIVVIVQDSLALSFSLAGIAGAARFRSSLKSSGDLMFILVSVAIGLSSGIGAVELAIVTSVVYNLCFVGLWATEFGERGTMKRYLSDFDPNDPESMAAAGTTTVTSVAAVMVEETRPGVDGPR